VFDLSQRHLKVLPVISDFHYSESYPTLLGALEARAMYIAHVEFDVHCCDASDGPYYNTDNVTAACWT
jgi:hypothetical protein